MEQNGTCWVPEKCSEMAVESMLGCATAIYFSDRFFSHLENPWKEESGALAHALAPGQCWACV